MAGYGQDRRSMMTMGCDYRARTGACSCPNPPYGCRTGSNAASENGGGFKISFPKVMSTCRMSWRVWTTKILYVQTWNVIPWIKRIFSACTLWPGSCHCCTFKQQVILKSPQTTGTGWFVPEICQNVSLLLYHPLLENIHDHEAQGGKIAGIFCLTTNLCEHIVFTGSQFLSRAADGRSGFEWRDFNWPSRK